MILNRVRNVIIYFDLFILEDHGVLKNKNK